jgi:TATA-binding protein-associated factor
VHIFDYTYAHTCGIAGVSNEVNQRLHRAALEDLAVRLLCVFALDRFGDFVSDQVVAPVRETCAQALGTVLQHVSIELANTIFQQLMCLVHQPDNREKIWQVRHAGLLGLKYAVAVRKDCVEAWIHDTVNAAIIG